MIAIVQVCGGRCFTIRPHDNAYGAVMNTALITGGSGGVGRAVAAQLHEAD